MVSADGRVNFRTPAPNAKEVKLVFGEWDIKPVDMHKNAKGDWETTIGPVAPGVYEYKFEIDGLKVLDYKNPAVKTGTEVYGSVVEVCASVPRFDQYVHVGSEVDVISYISTPLSNVRKSMSMFLPLIMRIPRSNCQCCISDMVEVMTRAVGFALHRPMQSWTIL